MTEQAWTDDVASTVMRDIVIALVVIYLVTVGIFLLAIGDRMQIVLLGSLLPAAVAGPFVGLLISLGRYLSSQGHGTAAVSSMPAPPTVEHTSHAA